VSYPPAHTSNLTRGAYLTRSNIMLHKTIYIMFRTILNEMIYSIAVRFHKTIKALIKFLGALLLLVLTPIPFILMAIEALITIPIGKIGQLFTKTINKLN